MKSLRYEHYLDFTSWVGFLSRSLQKLIKPLQDHLEKVKDSNTNNLQLESLNSDFVWESYGVWKLRKLEIKNLTGFQFFLLENKWREMERFKRKERRAFLSNKNRPHQPNPYVGRMFHTGPEGWLGRVAHGLDSPLSTCGTCTLHGVLIWQPLIGSHLLSFSLSSF